MDISAYRKKCMEEVRQAKTAAKAATKPAARGEVKPFADSSPPARRAATGSLPDDARQRLAALTLEPKRYAASIQTALGLLRDTSLETSLRLEALAFIQTATFTPTPFAPFNAEYVEALRMLTTDTDKAMRMAALERLAMASDPYAQKLLREGLEKARKPLVPDAKAVQLLGMDDHGAIKPLLRRLATTAKGKVRQEALRALANDPGSATLFASIGGDKGENRAVREIAALSLKTASPARFAKLAERIVLDDDDDDRLRATAMSAITHTQDVRMRLAKARFEKAVDTIATKSASRAMKASIGRFRSFAESTPGPIVVESVAAKPASRAKPTVKGKRLNPFTTSVESVAAKPASKAKPAVKGKTVATRKLRKPGTEESAGG